MTHTSILVLNGGSSSFKCALYEFSPDNPILASPPVFRESFEWSVPDLKPVLNGILKRAGPVHAVGHRIVHGGAYRTATWITPAVRKAIPAQAEIAAVHNYLS